MVRVCVADDDGTIREVVAEFLREEGYEVEAFDGGAALLDRLRTSWEPLIALLDLTMPQAGGMAFLVTLAREPSLSVRHRFLLATPYGWGHEPEVALLLLQTGVQMIEKPFTLDVLLEAVGEAAQALADAGV